MKTIKLSLLGLILIFMGCKKENPVNVISNSVQVTVASKQGMSPFYSYKIKAGQYWNGIGLYYSNGSDSVAYTFQLHQGDSVMVGCGYSYPVEKGANYILFNGVIVQKRSLMSLSFIVVN